MSWTRGDTSGPPPFDLRGHTIISCGLQAFEPMPNSYDCWAVNVGEGFYSGVGGAPLWEDICWTGDGATCWGNPDALYDQSTGQLSPVALAGLVAPTGFVGAASSAGGASGSMTISGSVPIAPPSAEEVEAALVIFGLVLCALTIVWGYRRVVDIFRGGGFGGE